MLLLLKLLQSFLLFLIDRDVLEGNQITPCFDLRTFLLELKALKTTSIQLVR